MILSSNPGRKKTNLVVPSNMNGIALDLVRDPKVNNLERPSDQHKVCRFEISMNDAVIMNDLNAFQHLK